MIDKRLKYKAGQRVAKSSTGKRPGYGGPQDRGEEARGTGGYSDATDTGGAGSEKANVANTKSAVSNLGMTSRDRAIANQYKNMPTPTVTVGVDKFDNPINIKTTYTEKRNRQKTLDALNARGISSFDPRVTKLGISPFGFFSPPEKKTGGFWRGLGTIAKNLALTYALGPAGLGGTKVGGILGKANSINKLAGLFGKDIDVKSALGKLGNPFGNFNTKGPTKKRNKTTGPKNAPRTEGDGGEPNQQNALLSEYILLLQRMEQGMLSAEEQGRFNSLKSRLGKADGGIMNVNMKKGRLGEQLRG